MDIFIWFYFISYRFFSCISLLLLFILSYFLTSLHPIFLSCLSSYSRSITLWRELVWRNRLCLLSLLVRSFRTVYIDNNCFLFRWPKNLLVISIFHFKYLSLFGLRLYYSIFFLFSFKYFHQYFYFFLCCSLLKSYHILFHLISSFLYIFFRFQSRLKWMDQLLQNKK